MSSALAEMLQQLNGDSWRIKNRFTEDILEANALLHNAAATDDEMAECVNLWCRRRQTCQFGKVGASEDRIHFCFLREKALREWTDGEISEKIAAEKRLWKQRAAFDVGRAAHSFVLVVASPNVALAAPDAHLKRLSDHILSLAGLGANRRGARHENSVAGDFLYLKHPKEDAYYGFRFNVDFFACAGDERWWHDHRFPGGIAFTANSTGHMIAFRDWYAGKEPGKAWALKQAMLTVDNAMPTGDPETRDPLTQGRATWLRPLDTNGQPFLRRVQCPLASIPKSLEGKDWTRYEGVLHTDHAVRDEFFVDRVNPPTASKPYLMDLTYLYDESLPDFVEFTGGERFTEEQIFQEIGHPEEWTHRRAVGPAKRSHDEAGEVAQALEACRSWASLYESDGDK